MFAGLCTPPGKVVIIKAVRTSGAITFLLVYTINLLLLSNGSDVVRDSYYTIIRIMLILPEITVLADSKV